LLQQKSQLGPLMRGFKGDQHAYITAMLQTDAKRKARDVPCAENGWCCG
jgi:hypothetical protein